jgi:hypothetical protein
MENIITKQDDEYELSIQLYAEIIYNMLQAQPNLYDELMPKTSFKLTENDEEENQTFKIAA